VEVAEVEDGHFAFGVALIPLVEDFVSEVALIRVEAVFVKSFAFAVASTQLVEGLAARDAWSLVEHLVDGTAAFQELADCLHHEITFLMVLALDLEPMDGLGIWTLKRGLQAGNDYCLRQDERVRDLVLAVRCCS